MSPENVNYIRIGFSIFSIAFGIWQYLKRRSVEHLISLEAVKLHMNVGIALGATQGALNDVNNSKSPANHIGMAEGMNQSMLFDSAKLFCNLRNTTIDDIDVLIKNGQLPEKFKHIYYSYSKGKIGLLRRLGKWMTKFW
jgi:hypothetical protein